MQQDSLLQVQEQVAEAVQTVAEQSPEVAVETAREWSNMLLMAGVGFSLVFIVLVLLIFVMKAMGVVFTRERKAKKVATVATAKHTEEDAMSDEELTAAIVTALKLYKSAVHDRESEILTINRITRAYSPWNSKIHGLTIVPEKK